MNQLKSRKEREMIDERERLHRFTAQAVDNLIWNSYTNSKNETQLKHIGTINKVIKMVYANQNIKITLLQ